MTDRGCICLHYGHGLSETRVISPGCPVHGEPPMEARQLTLDGRDTRVKTYVQKHYGPDWWAAKCVACGAALTKYAFTEQNAHDEAVHALDVPGHFQHRCRR